MNRVALLSCALLALAHGRMYERCELARDLQNLGVNAEHIATWVCIAYHESRFDTAAQNLYSGDHGLFQISELYWCGPGKACGKSCAEFRDDDIADDLDCALQVHEEHTRLQGNGFLAWVVYPQHCTYNTKKYLVGCDVKSSTSRTKSRVLSHEEKYYTNVNITHNVENLLPPYLAVSKIFRGSYGKVLNQDQNNVDWYNHKISNIDDLRLPSLYDKPSEPFTEPSTTTSSTTLETTSYIPPVKPWRRIETNQFRKKQLFSNNDNKITPPQEEHSSVIYYDTRHAVETTTPQITTRLTTSEQPTTTKTTTSSYPTLPSAKTSTVVVTTPSTQKTTEATSTTTTIIPSIKFETTSHRRRSTTTPTVFIPITQKPLTSTVPSTTEPLMTSSLSTKLSTFHKYTTRWTTRRPSTTKGIDATSASTARTTSFNDRRRYETTTTPSTRQPKSNFSWYTFTSRTTTPLNTINIQTSTSHANTSITRQQTTTPKPRTTQSIFDLYLNPTKPPKLPKYNFSAASLSRFGIKIFAGGTTTLAPTKLTT